MTSAMHSRGRTLTTAQRSSLEGEYANMLACVRCGACLTSCPTYVLTDHEAEGPRGRVAMIRAVLEDGLELTPDFLAHQQSCLICDACTAACPAGVRMDPLQIALRSVLPSRASWGERLGFALLRHMAWFRAVCRVLRLYQRSGLRWLAVHTGLLRLLGLERMERLLPCVPSEFLVPQGQLFPASVQPSPAAAGEGRVDTGSVERETGDERRDGWPGQPSPAELAVRVGPGEGRVDTGSVERETGDERRDGWPGQPSPAAAGEGRVRVHGAQPAAVERVQLFAGCIMSIALADIDRATIRALQASGCEVELTAGQGCCGALNAHGGDLARAQEMARQNIEAFEGGGTIVVNSAGCGALLKDYGHLLAADPAWAERARSFSQRVKDVTEVLACRPAPQRRIEPEAVAYQDACHLAHAQGIRRQPRALLRAVQGLELKELGDAGLCCGSAGIYNLLHPEQANELQRRKVESIIASGATTVVTCNPGCLLQIRAGLAEADADIQVKHLVELLDEAWGPLPEGEGT